MKKHVNILLFAIAFVLNVSAQFRIKIKTDKDEIDTPLVNKKSIMINKIPSEILIKREKNDMMYVLTQGDEIAFDFPGDGEFHSVNFRKARFDDNKAGGIQINEKGKVDALVTFELTSKATSTETVDSGNDGGANLVNSMTLQEYVDFLGFDQSNLQSKQYGMIVTGGNTLYVGNQYVHIFLDQYGNSIYGTIPQGISDRQYVVHVFYQTKYGADSYVFDIKKTKGAFNPALNFLNSNIRDSNAKPTSAKISTDYSWVHKEFLIATSTSDIGFDLTRTAIPDATKPYIYKNDKIASYIINMTPVYHGSFNFGFVNSHLKNPSYKLLSNPANASEQVVKAGEGDNRGIVTAMATIYTSPVVLLRKLFGGKTIPWNKTYGRNFLDDHKLFERIYPAIGVGFTDKTFENIFYGFNWEAIRGAGLFIGWHWGKINTFRTDGDFKFEKTAITQEEFDLRSDKKWSTKFSIGINVDPVIVTRLFGTGFQ